MYFWRGRGGGVSLSSAVSEACAICEAFAVVFSVSVTVMNRSVSAGGPSHTPGILDKALGTV